MKNKLLYYIVLIIFIGCANVRGPKYSVYKGGHKLPGVERNTMALLITNDEEAGEKDTPVAKLANVMLVSFNNLTKTKNYDWLSASIAEAVDLSMVNKFDYKKVNPLSMFEAVTNLQTNSEEERLNEVKKLAQKNSADIIISGTYVLNEKKDGIVISAYIYYNHKKTNIGLVKENSALDSSLFMVTDTISEKIVQTIFNYEIKK